MRIYAHDAVDDVDHNIARIDRVICDTSHFCIEVKETIEGVIIDVFDRQGELFSTFPLWNDDTEGVI